MTSKSESGASSASAPAVSDSEALSVLLGSFRTHKYLLLAILNCIQERYPRRPRPLPRVQSLDPAIGYRWMRETSAGYEATPCVVMREHHDRGGLSARTLHLEKMVLQQRSLANWMRSEVPPTSDPDSDIVHLAIAPALPTQPIFVHSISADGSTLTHLFSEGTWTLCADDDVLLRAIRLSRLVATVNPMGSTPRPEAGMARASSDMAPLTNGANVPSDLVALGRQFDHITVHAALTELSKFRRGVG